MFSSGFTKSILFKDLQITILGLLRFTNPAFSQWLARLYESSKHDTLTQCCFNVGPASLIIGHSTVTDLNLRLYNVCS